MLMRSLIAAALVMGSVLPAFAEDYYVVQDPSTKRCTIVREKPSSSSSLTILGITVFKTQNDAEGYIKEQKVCTSD